MNLSFMSSPPFRTGKQQEEGFSLNQQPPVSDSSGAHRADRAGDGTGGLEGRSGWYHIARNASSVRRWMGLCQFILILLPACLSCPVLSCLLRRTPAPPARPAAHPLVYGIPVLFSHSLIIYTVVSCGPWGLMAHPASGKQREALREAKRSRGLPAYPGAAAVGLQWWCLVILATVFLSQVEEKE